MKRSRMVHQVEYLTCTWIPTSHWFFVSCQAMERLRSSGLIAAKHRLVWDHHYRMG